MRPTSYTRNAFFQTRSTSETILLTVEPHPLWAVTSWVGFDLLRKVSGKRRRARASLECRNSPSLHCLRDRILIVCEIGYLAPSSQCSQKKDGQIKIGAGYAANHKLKWGLPLTLALSGGEPVSAKHTHTLTHPGTLSLCPRWPATGLPTLVICLQRKQTRQPSVFSIPTKHNTDSRSTKPRWEQTWLLPTSSKVTLVTCLIMEHIQHWKHIIYFYQMWTSTNTINN